MTSVVILAENPPLVAGCCETRGGFSAKRGQILQKFPPPSAAVAKQGGSAKGGGVPLEIPLIALLDFIHVMTRISDLLTDKVAREIQIPKFPAPSARMPQIVI